MRERPPGGGAPTTSGSWALRASRSRAARSGADMRATPGGVKHRRAEVPQLGHASAAAASATGRQASNPPQRSQLNA